MAEKISQIPIVAVVGDLAATTAGLEVSTGLGTAPVTRRLTLGVLRDFLAAAATGFAAVAVTVLALRGPANIVKLGTDAAGNDAAATAHTFVAPLSTGIGVPGAIIQQMGTLGTSGAVAQVPVTLWQGIGSVVSSGVAMPVFNVPISAGSWYGGYATAAASMRPDEASAARCGAVGDNLDSAAFRSYMFHNTLTMAAGVLTRRALGTGAAPLVPTVNTVLGTFACAGYINSGTQLYGGNTAALRLMAAETYSATNQGTYIDLATTAIGATARAVRAIISPTGLFVLGATMAAGVPALKPSGTTLQARLGDDSGYAPFDAASFKVAGVAGASGTGVTLTALTVVNGIVTAISIV